MTDYDDTNRGALFRNDKKESDRHPDYKGSLNVGGTEYWISAWLKEAKSGTKYMSLAVTAKEAKAETETAPRPQGGGFDDDVPFAAYMRGSVA
jgi:uncharacterized protein (DUF736 family)